MSGGDYHVEVHGSVGGNLVVGDHNLIVNAAVGSSVTVLQEGQRPTPSLRSSVRLLPRRPSGFIGRTAELAAIASAVATRSTIQVYGISGVGKSSLLRQAAYQVAGDVAYLTVSGRDIDDVLQEIFEACYDTSGYRPGSTELRRLMSGVRVCVLADDLVASDDSLAMILDTAPDTAFAFAAVDRELWGQGEAIALGGLPEDQALQLFRREFARELTSAEVAAASRAWRESSGSPIAMLRAAATLAGAPNPTHPAIPAQRDPDDPERTVALPVPLTAAQRDAFELLRALPQGPISASAMTALVGAPAEQPVEEAAQRLVAVGLADETADDTYQLPLDLVAPSVRYRRDVGAMADSMQEWLSNPDTDPADAAANGAIIIGLVDGAVASGQARAGCRLARAAASMFARSLRWGLWRDLLVSGQAAATACDDKEALAYFTHERGIRMLCLGQMAAAAGLLAAAATMWQALGLAQSANIAAQAQTLAAAAIHPAGAMASAVDVAPSAAGPGASAGAPARGNLPVPRPPRPARRFIGRAVVHPRGGVPVIWILVAAVLVVALIVAGLVLFAWGRHAPDDQSAATPTRIAASTSPSATASPLPLPFAYSDYANERSDPNQVLDDDPSTVWTSMVVRTPLTPMWIAVDMGGVASWSGVSITPAADGVGFPAAFHLEYRADNATWNAIPGQIYNSAHPFNAAAGAQTLIFDQPVQARYIKLAADQLWTGPPSVTTGASVSRAFGMQVAEFHVLA